MGRSPWLKLRDAAAGGPSAELALEPFSVSVYGRQGRPGRHERYASTEILEGKGRNAELATPKTDYAKKDLFVGGGWAVMPPVERLILTLPQLQVNGNRTIDSGL